MSSWKKSLRGDLSFQFAGAAGVVAILDVFYYESCAHSAAAGKGSILHLPDNANANANMLMIMQGKWISVAIALAIALLTELPIEFPMHLLIAFGCLAEAFRYLFRHFLLPFGNLSAPFGRLGQPFLDPGTTPGPFRARGAKVAKHVTIC